MVSALNAYTPRGCGAVFTIFPDMFGVDAIFFSPFFDSYPNPPLTNTLTDITNGLFGLGSTVLIDNVYWRIYGGKLGLGQAVFEAAGWSGALAGSTRATHPWFRRGGYSPNLAGAGVESIYSESGLAYGGNSFRAVVLITP
ncbi:hypothetical protein FWH09_03375, partial [Candidatus Saccharibacteria bacterium]|nr:hypothetical protein [Candidatus Saccharibacteria bacterium]